MTLENRPENQYCQPLSVSLNETGQLEFCELKIEISHQSYTIKVATPNYIASLKEHNLSLPEELQLDDNIYPYNGDLNHQLCQTLLHTPFDQLKPFLNEPLNPPAE